MRSLLAWWLVLGCTGPAVPAPHAEPASAPPPPAAPEPPVEEVPLLATPGALDGHMWMSFEPTGHRGSCGLGDGGLGPRCDPHFIGDPRTYEAVVIEGAPHLVRRDAEVVVFDVVVEALRGASELVVDLDTGPFVVWVAGVRDGAVVLARLDGEDGTAIASVLVASPDDVGATGVRIARDADAVALHVRADAPWLALVRASDLRLLDRRPVGVRMDEFVAERTWSRAGRRATLALDGLPHVATGRTVRGPGWTHTIDDPMRCRAYALAATGTEILAAYHCPASSGASLSFLDRATGTPLAELHPGTIGTIGHSAYRAEVFLAVEGDRAYLRGEEAGGRYVAIVDVGLHRALGVNIWRD